MAQEFSVEAVLSVDDSHFGSAFKNAASSIKGLTKQTESATSSIKNIAAGIGVFKAVSASVNLIRDSIGGAVKRIDTLNNANRVFKNMGFSAQDTQKAMDGLNDSIHGLPTSLDEGVQGMELLASSMGDVGKAQQVFSALNDGILGFGGSTAEVNNAVLQLSQAFAGGKVDAETWNSMLDSGLGPALNAIAKTMGKTTAQLKDGLSSGKISVSQFQDALVSLDKNGGGGLASLHQIAMDALGGISTSMANAKTAVTRGVADIIKAIDTGLAANHLPTIAQAISTAGSVIESVLQKVSNVIPGVISKITSFGKSLIPWGPILKVAAAGVTILVAAIMSSSKIVSTITMFKEFGKALSSFGNIISLMGGTITALVAIILTLGAAFTFIYSKSKPLQDAVSNLGAALNNLFGPAITAISNKLTALAGKLNISNSTIQSWGQSLANVVNKIANFINQVAKMGIVQSILTTVSSAIKAVVNAFNSLPSSVQKVIGVLAAVTASGLLFNGFLSKGSGLFGLFSKSASSTSKTSMSFGGILSGIIGKLPSLVSGLGSAAATFGGPVVGGIGKVVAASGPLISRITEIASKTPAGARAMTLLGGAGKVLGPIFAALSGPIGIFIGALALISGAVSLANGNFDAISAKITQFGQNFAQIGPVVGKSMGQVIQGIVTGIAAALPAIASGFLTLGAAIMAQAPIMGAAVGMAMNGILNGIALAIPGIVAGLASIALAITAQIPTIVAALTMMFTAFVAAVTVNLPTIVASVALLIATFLNALAANIGQIIAAGANLITQFLIGLAQALPQIMPAAIQVIVAFVNGLADGIGPVITAGANFIVKLLQGLTKAMPTIIPAAVDAIVTFVEGIGNNLGKIINAAVDLIGKFILGLINAIPRITAYAVQAVLQFVEGVGEALGQVLGSGGKLISYFVKGILKGISDSRNAGKSNANAAKDGTNGVSLHANGAAIMKSFLSGLKSVWGDIQNFVGGIADWIREHKGPISYDKKLLIPAGNAIMGGLNNGLQDSFKDVKSTVNNMSSAIQNSLLTKLPSIDTSAYSRSLNSLNRGISNGSLNNNLDVNYSRGLIVQTQLNINGRPFAEAINDDMTAVQQRTQKQNNIAKGLRY